MAVVIKEVSYELINCPDFVKYGSKPSRDIQGTDGLSDEIVKHLRSYEDVLNYAPHQAFIGNMFPDELRKIEQPWYDHPLTDGKRKGLFGEILPEDEFYAWMKAADDFDLLWLDAEFVKQIRDKFSKHPFVTKEYVAKLGDGKTIEEIKAKIDSGDAIPMTYNENLIGALRRDHDNDDTLKSIPLLENLMAKASGTLAIKQLFERAKINPEDIDMVLDCTETAIGDRYNRGGGSLSKAMAEMSGCTHATGNDIRAFCCAPAHALVNAAGLVESGIWKNVIVAGGGCLAKVGMKYAAHLKKNMPILEDVLGAMAFLITKDDGLSPIMRIDAIGKHDVGAGSGQQNIMTSLVVNPLKKMGYKITDIDKFGTEMHNPEVTLPAGSGNTPYTNYKIIGALAAMNKEIGKDEIEQFVIDHGFPGYCPTQGHIPSAVPILGHAIEAIKAGKMKRAMFVAKGSLFLGRMSQLSDGMSFLIEQNPNKH